VRVALTGGIATGKSVVGRALRQEGVATVDADELAREAVAPGSPGLAAVVARFGAGVTKADGTLDRAALAALVFADAAARADLERLVHPRVRAGINGFLAALPPGTPVDMVYNRLTDFDLSDPTHTALREAYATGATVLTPNPRTHALAAHKRNLITLGDDAQLAAWGVPEDDRAVLRSTIPHTTSVRPDTADALWAARRTLFFKPVAGYGAKAAYRGDKLTKRVWAEIVAGDFIAQELVPPSERMVEVDGAPTLLKLDVRAYTYQGHIQLLAARTYSGQTTNMRTPGGGFCPVLVLPRVPVADTGLQLPVKMDCTC